MFLFDFLSLLYIFAGEETPKMVDIMNNFPVNNFNNNLNNNNYLFINGKAASNQN